ncbi:MAG TPA: ankyrin repeat domain-containing protein [Patescibacteria group bacterium]|nr:ankyrin repeat domain-containing protein [Patescibacteria group bacterium]
MSYAYATTPPPVDLNTDTLWTRRSDAAPSSSFETVALLRAAREGDTGKIRLLVETGADVDSADENGWTPLFWAIKNRHVKTVAEFIINGASLKSEARNGLTPLSLAVKTSSPLIISLVTRAGAK